MSKALIVVIHNNSFNFSPLWRILWEYFKLELLLWKGTFDKLYLVDNCFGFNESDKDFLRLNGFNYHIEKIVNISVEDGLNRIFEKVKEDTFLLIHSDTFIYRKEVIEHGFDALRTYDVATIFDGSGKKLSDKFPIMRENKYRSERARFCNYLWFGKMKDMRAISCDFTVSYTYGECASYITEQLLERNVKVHELQDDRSNILYDGSSITRVQWLDTPDKLWSNTYPLDLGYYHVRNFSNGFEVVNDFHNNKPSYDGRKAMIPKSEILRILAWEKMIANKINEKFAIDDVIHDLGIGLDGWNNYLKEFKSFHSFL